MRGRRGRYMAQADPPPMVWLLGNGRNISAAELSLSSKWLAAQQASQPGATSVRKRSPYNIWLRKRVELCLRKTTNYWRLRHCS